MLEDTYEVLVRDFKAKYVVVGKQHRAAYDFFKGVCGSIKIWRSTTRRFTLSSRWKKFQNEIMEAPGGE
jgi:hypothetical protein